MGLQRSLGLASCGSTRELFDTYPLQYLQEEEEEEEAIDHQEVLKEKCAETPKCTKLHDLLDSCNERVESKTNTAETCVEELMDFVHCVDHCVSCYLKISTRK